MARGIYTKKDNWESILVINNPKFNHIILPDFDRIITSDLSTDFKKEIKDFLEFSYKPVSGLNTGLCKDINYIFSSEYALDDSDILILVMDKSSDLFIGQLAIRETRELDIWHVILLCGYPGIKGLGSFLIDKLEEICKLNGIIRLELSSVFDAVEFYKKKGFSTTDGLEMAKDI